jgi:hypothetical protein
MDMEMGKFHKSNREYTNTPKYTNIRYDIKLFYFFNKSSSNYAKIKQ